MRIVHTEVIYAIAYNHMDVLTLRIRGSVKVNRQLNILIDHMQNVWHID